MDNDGALLQRLGGRNIGAVAARAILAVAAVVILVLILRGGDHKSYEESVRAWFATPAGGDAAQAVLPAIHVSGCFLTELMSQSRQVLKCEVTTDAPNPTLHSCFVISGEKVLRGGWQLAALDACNALRFDARAGDLVDVSAAVHYRVVAA